MYVITGAGGFLGSYLIKEIIEKTDEKIIALARTDDVYCRDNDRVKILKGDLRDDSYLSEIADIINSDENVRLIHTAACHNIDFVAENPDEAYYLNVTVTEKLLDRINKYDKILFTSSDTVYGEGGNHPFTEDDELLPVSIYGCQKLAAEKAVTEKGGTALRLPLMFSPSISPSKKHFCDIIRENIENEKETTLITGAFRSALDHGSVAEIIVALSLLDELPPIINIGGDRVFSKYELGVYYAEVSGFNKKFLIPVESSGSFAPGAERTESTVLSNNRLKKLLGRSEIKINL